MAWKLFFCAGNGDLVAMCWPKLLIPKPIRIWWPCVGPNFIFVDLFEFLWLCLRFQIQIIYRGRLFGGAGVGAAPQMEDVVPAPPKRRCRQGASAYLGRAGGDALTCHEIIYICWTEPRLSIQLANKFCL
jgi:hypothetical protein